MLMKMWFLILRRKKVEERARKDKLNRVKAQDHSEIHLNLILIIIASLILVK